MSELDDVAVDQDEVSALKALAIEMSRDPREVPSARQRALMACIVLPAAIQQWMIEAGAVEPLLDSIEKTILAAEEHARPAPAPEGWKNISSAPEIIRGSRVPLGRHLGRMETLPDGTLVAIWHRHGDGIATYWLSLPSPPRREGEGK